MRNPWENLPEKYPYVLPGDKEEVDVYNREIDVSENEKKVLDWMIPMPFAGDPNAPIYLLGKVPPVGENETQEMHLNNASKHKNYQQAMKDNLKHELDPEFPLFFLKEEYADTPLAQWWRHYLKDLIEEVGEQTVAKNICIVEYFPYFIKSFNYTALHVPSQKYGFDMVYEAAKSRRMILAQYSLKKWIKDVKILRNYEEAYDTKSSTASVLNKKNLTKDVFAKVVEVLKNPPAHEAIKEAPSNEEEPQQEVEEELEQEQEQE